MRRLFPDQETAAALILIAAAAGTLVLAALTNRGDLPSAALILAGFACFVTGVYFLTFSRGTAVEGNFSGLLPAGGCIALARVLGDLGIQGDAVMVPGADRSSVVQVNPLQEGIPSTNGGDSSFLIAGGETGVKLVPSGMALLSVLLSRHNLVLPQEEQEIGPLLSEVFTRVWEVADRVEIEREGDSLVVRIRGFLLMEGCRVVRRESPKCCTLYPCPVCSCTACITALVTSLPCRVSAVMTDDRRREIRVILVPVKPEGVFPP